MEGPRPPHESEFPNILSFLNSQLRPEVSWSIQKEYPTALNLGNRMNLRIITDQEKIIAHAVLKPLIIKTPFVIFKVAAIGSVVTDTNYRNQGLGQQTIEACVEEARRQDCDLAILWTNMYDFYRKMNFELVGCENTFVIDRELPFEATGYQFLNSLQVDPAAILKLYNQHSVTSFRTQEDVRKFLQIPQTKLYTAWDKNGQLAAYAVEGKGLDLTGYIHEWGGMKTPLLKLLKFIQNEKKSPFTLITPHHSFALNEVLKKVSTAHNEGFLGMIRVVKEDSLFTKLTKAAYAQKAQAFQIQRRGSAIVLGLETSEIQFEDERSFLKFIFGPQMDLSGLTPSEIKMIEGILPLPLWIWGWDSI